MKSFKPWLIVALVVQLLTAGFHVLSLIVETAPANDTEKMLVNLLETYRMDMGAGYHRTLSELMTALSACFTLLCLLGGINNWYLLHKKADPSLILGLLNIQIGIFGLCFGLMNAFTFLPPIVLTGLIFFLLLIARFLLAKQQRA